MYEYLIWSAVVLGIGGCIAASPFIAMRLERRFRYRRHREQLPTPHRSQLPDSMPFTTNHPVGSDVALEPATLRAIRELGFRPDDFGELRPTRRPGET
jgi:hypothetical protein